MKMLFNVLEMQFKFIRELGIYIRNSCKKL